MTNGLLILGLCCTVEMILPVDIQNLRLPMRRISRALYTDHEELQQAGITISITTIEGRNTLSAAWRCGHPVESSGSSILSALQRHTLAVVARI
ncbi:hypothetical protein B0T20DRAFT_404164 [Sordaria brevicollis]|uniref:Uncharacterized protein n=1 Tax=Sordaria brevicollis TaxID=83679 RepID=A0AAE0PLQ9_SORBR|nr:hypothetical protein B0T20DRAFT_404164 [Sordaria brevicollis]